MVYKSRGRDNYNMDDAAVILVQMRGCAPAAAASSTERLLFDFTYKEQRLPL